MQRQLIEIQRKLVGRQRHLVRCPRMVQHTMHVLDDEPCVRLHLQHRHHNVLPDAQSHRRITVAALAQRPQQRQTDGRPVLVRIAEHRIFGQTLDAHAGPLDGDQLQHDLVAGDRQSLGQVVGECGQRLVEEIVNVCDACVAQHLVDERLQTVGHDVGWIARRMAAECGGGV